MVPILGWPRCMVALSWSLRGQPAGERSDAVLGLRGFAAGNALVPDDRSVEAACGAMTVTCGGWGNTRDRPCADKAGRAAARLDLRIEDPHSSRSARSLAIASAAEPAEASVGVWNLLRGLSRRPLISSRASLTGGRIRARLLTLRVGSPDGYRRMMAYG